MKNNSLFLYKYQPTTFQQFFNDNKYCIQFLYNIFKNKHIKLLIVGNSETGKTTLIKIIIQEYFKFYNLSYDKNCIIYINHFFLENNSNYLFQELNNICKQTYAYKNKKKIIVIDDFDFFSDTQQKIFKNYIDLYSKNIIFLFSCNNTLKINNNIYTRLYVIQIPKNDYETSYKIVKNIIDNENIHINQNIIDYIIHSTKFNIKTIINILEKIKLYKKKINIHNIKTILNHIQFNCYDKYIYHLQNKNICDAIIIFNNIYKQGYSIMDIFNHFYKYILQNNILQQNYKYKIIKIISKYFSIYHMNDNLIILSLFTFEVFNYIYY